MNIINDRRTCTTVAVCHVIVPAGSTVRRVEARLTTIPPAFPDASTALIDICAYVFDPPDESTWLFGQEAIQGRRPIVWEGILKSDVQAHIWCYFQNCTAGNQAELGVTYEQ
jgi:hypothetical protein